MSESSTGESAEPVPVIYVTDLAYDRFDPADLFDLAFLIRSPHHQLHQVCLTDPDGDGRRVIDALAARAGGGDIECIAGSDALMTALAAVTEPVNLIVVGGYGVVWDALSRGQSLFRRSVARLFLVGGHANDYRQSARRLPIDPRLEQRHPERFAVDGDPRIGDRENRAWGHLLTSGEGVIWLPRDNCLWRYAAPGVLADGGPTAEFLLRELFYAHLAAGVADRYAAADAPVLLSSLPALLLAVQPDPFAWMRLFRAVTARVEIDADDRVTSFSTTAVDPNIYAVVAIDGQALGKLLTARLRDRPLEVV